MKCPYCGQSESKVVDSRPADEGNSIRRRRECLSCQKRFTTYETVESLPISSCPSRGAGPGDPLLSLILPRFPEKWYPIFSFSLPFSRQNGPFLPVKGKDCRRECLSCQKRFTTYETVESLPIIVVKKDGSRESFDRQKVLGGMIRACEKRKVPLAELEAAVDGIEQELQNAMDREVKTNRIGEMVMDRLKGIDEVAYVRFASVYRQFKDIDTFMTELNKLLSDK